MLTSTSLHVMFEWPVLMCIEWCSMIATSSSASRWIEVVLHTSTQRESMGTKSKDDHASSSRVHSHAIWPFEMSPAGISSCMPLSACMILPLCASTDQRACSSAMALCTTRVPGVYSPLCVAVLRYLHVKALMKRSPLTIHACSSDPSTSHWPTAAPSRTSPPVTSSALPVCLFTRRNAIGPVSSGYILSVKASAMMPSVSSTMLPSASVDELFSPISMGTSVSTTVVVIDSIL